MTIETANRLFELRKKHNLSQEELAEKLGVSRQAVSKWERSEASPDTDNLIALAKIYGLSLDELVYGEKEEISNKKEAKENFEEPSVSEEARNNEELYIDIDDGEDKVKIGSNGIVVEEKNGNTVKINVNGKIMEKVFKKIEDKIDDCDDDDDDDDELYETVYSSHRETKNGNQVHIKVTRPAKFWLEVPYPIICGIAYLIFGFCDILGGWGMSWVIFITIPLYYSFVEAIYKKSFAHFAYPVLCAFVYMIAGVYFNHWHPSWLIFATIPVYYPIANALDKMIKNRK